MAITNDVITGTSKYIADWSSAGFDPAKGTNFVAIHLKGETGATLTCECIPSQGSPTPSFTDDDVVLQITPETKGVRVTSTKDGVTKSDSYGLNMTLEEE